MYRFDEYRLAILRHYEQEIAANRLSLNIVFPTVAGLRDEAILICQNRFQKKDENVLVAFFEYQSDIPGYVQAIKKNEDYFRPVYNFLKGKTSNPEEKQIELLAWLTNFAQRPYQNYILVNPLPLTGKSGSDPVAGEISETSEKEVGKWSFLSKRSVLMSLALLLLTVGGYLGFIVLRKGDCMYWKKDHYEVISCEASAGYGIVTPYDAVKLKEFRMVNEYDTLTDRSLEKVWYVQTKDGFEFYTSNGIHPRNPDLKLKPLSDYILNTVVRQQRNRIMAAKKVAGKALD